MKKQKENIFQHIERLKTRTTPEPQNKQWLSNLEKIQEDVKFH